MKVIRALIAVVALTLVPRAGMAADAPPGVVSPQPELFTDQRKFEGFVERYFSAEALERNRVVGAVVLAVDANGVVFERGYGVRDIGSGEPVDPRRDIFFVASVSKTLLGTAVMRLVQEGRLRLDDDLRKVIRSFKVPDSFGQPILVRHALTHTTGIVDRMDGTSAPSPESMIPLVDLFRQFPAEQIAPPGKVTSYCNYCIAMLAVAIQDITGLDYRDYLLREVIQPLGMDATTIVLPPMRNAAALADRLVSTYLWDRRQGRFTKYPPMSRSLYPNGAVASSAESMGRFMRMFLNEGTLDGKPFLRPELVRDMMSPHDWPHPKVPTFGLALKYGVQNGVRYLGHSGNYRGADTSMVIFPDYGFAYFLSYTGGNATYHRRFLVDLIDTAFPRLPGEADTVTAATLRLDRYAGRYTDFRFHLNTPMAFAMLFPGQMTVTANDDGTLTLRVPKPYFDGGTARYAAAGPNLFRKIDSGDAAGIGPNLIDYLTFIEDDRGEIKYFTTAVNNHAISAIKEPWYRHLDVAVAALATTSIMFVTYLIGLTSISLWQRVRNRRRPASMPWIPRASAVILAISAPAFVGKYLLTMTSQQDWTILYSFQALGLHPWFALPIVAAAATVVLLASMYSVWRRQLGTTATRVCYSGLGLAGAIFTLQMAEYRVLDYYF